MKFLFFLCTVLWFSTAVGGVFYLARYENAPAGEDVFYPAVFPPQSLLERDAERPTLVFFAHPKCPCTRASLRELARLMTETDGKLRAYVVFNQPENESEKWTETDLRRSAEAIPNVRVLIDEGERETRIFNAQTSSLTLLYDRDGNLRFSGGITAARGHEGDNAGRRAVFEIVAREAAEKIETPVFGCPLHKKDCPGELIQERQK